MRLAIISDIHGNRLALEAVLEDVARCGVDGIVNLGDNFAGPMDPAGVAAILRDLDLPNVMGNHDRYLVEAHGPSDLGAVDRFVAAALSDSDLAWVRSLPARNCVDDQMFLCHGSPMSDMTHWLEGLFDGRSSTLPDEAEVAALADGIDFPILACGHTHLPRQVRLRDGRMIVNPGSVGLQFVHGSPDARYCVVTCGEDNWSIDLRVIGYDHQGAAAQAERNGFAHWRDALTTGWAGPEGLF